MRNSIARPDRLGKFNVFPVLHLPHVYIDDGTLFVPDDAVWFPVGETEFLVRLTTIWAGSPRTDYWHVGIGEEAFATKVSFDAFAVFIREGADAFHHFKPEMVPTEGQ